MYSHTRVTISPNAPTHSMYFGAPCSAPFSMKSKSSTRFNAATMQMKTLMPMPIGPESCRNGMETPKKPRINEAI